MIGFAIGFIGPALLLIPVLLYVRRALLQQAAEDQAADKQRAAFWAQYRRI